jgi:hypothetical protein
MLSEFQEENDLSFDDYEIKRTPPLKKYFVIVRKAGKQLVPIPIEGSDIDNIPVNKHVSAYVKWSLREAIWKRMHPVLRF